MDMDRKVGWAFCLVSISYFWLAGPLAQLGFGCQIFNWLLTPLPGYRTLCSPGTKPKAHQTRHNELRETWQEVADWRELALAPRSAKMHDKLQQGTKELPTLKIGDHVMLQN